MKIEKNGKTVKFVDIWIGGCFMNDNAYFMKANGSEVYNAVSLHDGELWNFKDDEMVIPANAKVVIE